MIEFTIEVAGHTADVTAMYGSTQTYCRNYLSQNPAEFSLVLTPADIAFEREKSAREAALEGLPHREFPDPYLETIALQRKLAEELFDHDVLLFHGSAVAVDGNAYLFTAKSGTGKSTHARLWREALGDRAVMVNDDKPFLRFGTDTVLVCGSPWNGKHGLGSNTSVPLKAICVLEQGVTNHISPIPPSEALPFLIQQSNRPRAAARMPKYLELIDRLSRKVKFYRLTCNMDPSAAILSYTTMSGNPL